jgi:hypothetical protein
MNRRNFLYLLTGTAIAAAMEEAVPFGRVWSFPSNLTIHTADELNQLTLKYIVPVLADEVFTPSPVWWVLTKNGNRFNGMPIIETVRHTKEFVYARDN